MFELSVDECKMSNSGNGVYFSAAGNGTRWMQRKPIWEKCESIPSIDPSGLCTLKVNLV